MPRLGLQDLLKIHCRKLDYQRPAPIYLRALIERIDDSFPVQALAPSPENCIFRPDNDRNP